MARGRESMYMFNLWGTHCVYFHFKLQRSALQSPAYLQHYLKLILYVCNHMNSGFVCCSQESTQVSLLKNAQKRWFYRLWLPIRLYISNISLISKEISDKIRLSIHVKCHYLLKSEYLHITWIFASIPIQRK